MLYFWPMVSIISGAILVYILAWAMSFVKSWLAASYLWTILSSLIWLGSCAPLLTVNKNLMGVILVGSVVVMGYSSAEFGCLWKARKLCSRQRKQSANGATTPATK